MKFRFVVADDATFIREIIKNIGSSLGGVCVGEAENGKETLQIIKQTLPDLLFLDLVMPLRNGLEILPDLKEAWPDLLIIACSTLDQESLQNEALSKGVHRYIVKPFSKSDITEAINDLIYKRKDQKHV
jgi:two-component system, chemotaxis family, chemotaxis protein CheY